MNAGDQPPSGARESGKFLKEGEIDLAPELWGPVFEPLTDNAEFAKLRADPELDTIVWPNGADFSLGWLHGRLKALEAAASP